MPNNEWYTPKSILDPARMVLGEFDLDPASCEAAQKRVKARRFYTKEQNGLTHPWYGCVWLNPPYERALISRFVSKLLVELASGRVTAAIMLVDNCTDTAWFRKAARAAAVICFTEGRIQFIMPDGGIAGSPPRGQALFYFGSDADKFMKHFAGLGLVGKLARRKSPPRDRRLIRAIGLK